MRRLLGSCCDLLDDGVAGFLGLLAFVVLWANDALCVRALMHVVSVRLRLTSLERWLVHLLLILRLHYVLLRFLARQNILLGKDQLLS